MRKTFNFNFCKTVHKNLLMRQLKIIAIKPTHTRMLKANAYVKELDEFLKHLGDHKLKDHHGHHHHLHFFHLHHQHKDAQQLQQQQQQTGMVEKYREVSSAIDEPINCEQEESSSAPISQLTVGRRIYFPSIIKWSIYSFGNDL